MRSLLLGVTVIDEIERHGINARELGVKVHALSFCNMSPYVVFAQKGKLHKAVPLSRVQPDGMLCVSITHIAIARQSVVWRRHVFVRGA